MDLQRAFLRTYVSYVQQFEAGGQVRATLAIERAMQEIGLPNLDPILGAGGTEHFLNGTWPKAEQVQQIELALGWPYGTAQSIWDRPPYAHLSGTEHALVDMVHRMSEPERRGLIELLKVTAARAKAHAEEVEGDLRLVEGELA